MPPKKETVDPGESSSSTLAVSKEIADRVRGVAKDAGTTAFEVTNQLLLYGLEHGKINVQVKTITITPRASGKK